MKWKWLTFSGKVSNNTCRDTQDDRGPEWDKARSWRRSDESRNTARTPANHGPFLGESVIEEHPRSSRHHSGKTRVKARIHRSQIRAERRPAIKSQPSKPQQYRAQRDKRDVMRPEIKHHLLLPLPQHHAVRQRRETGYYFDGPAAGVVENPVFECPSVDIPYPACDWAVDECGPEENKYHAWDQAAALGNRTHDNRRRDSTEHHLPAY